VVLVTRGRKGVDGGELHLPITIAVTTVGAPCRAAEGGSAWAPLVEYGEVVERSVRRGSGRRGLLYAGKGTGGGAGGGDGQWLARAGVRGDVGR
jgi:hypothetical protein